MQVAQLETSALSDSTSHRYRLSVADLFEHGLEIQVTDTQNNSKLFNWDGYVARHIINSGELDYLETESFCCYTCDKQLISHLALLAAASHTIYSSFPAEHRYIVKTMLDNSNEHLTVEDIRLLLLVNHVELCPCHIETCLNELADWKRIQKIIVNDQNVFYDIDTRKHDHIFDPVKRRLYDA